MPGAVPVPLNRSAPERMGGKLFHLRPRDIHPSQKVDEFASHFEKSQDTLPCSDVNLNAVPR